MFKKNLISLAITVSCSQPSGYRRANRSFLHGSNTIPADEITAEQLEALKNDPRLVVQETQTPAVPVQEPSLDSTGVGAVVIDLDEVPSKLHTFIEIMLDQRFDKKPTVDQLTYTVTGHEGQDDLTIKPSAADRDAAWDIYSQALAQG